MTWNRDYLFDVINIAPCLVTLPYGKLSSTEKCGNFQIRTNLILDNVLYIPQLTRKLISISQLLKSIIYYVSFELSKCAIKDHSSKTLIRVVDLRNGLYFFRDVARVNKMQGGDSRDLWHRRLGHPLDSFLKFFV